MGIAPGGLSRREHSFARSERDSAVACFDAPENSGGVAGRGAVCGASGLRGIGGVDNRAEERAVGSVFPGFVARGLEILAAETAR